MAIKQGDLHGNAPDSSGVALLVIDMLNDFDYPGGDGLLAQALDLAERLAELAARARKASVPVIYVNDNKGRWRSDRQQLIAALRQPGVAGRPVVEKLLPGPEDYFVLKPKNSGFFQTTLGLLLDYLQVHTLVLAGIAGDNCILFTANDAYLRDFRLIVVEDCVASIDPRLNANALELMANVLHADVAAAASVDFKSLLRRDRATR